MASKSIQKRPNGKWRARYRDETGREHARHFDRKVDAQRWLDEQTSALVTGTHVDPNAGKTTVRTYAAQWEQQQLSRDATARIIDNALRLHILPTLGDKPLKAVRRSDVQALVKSLTGSLSPGTVRNIHSVAARLFASAVDDRLIASSPCERVTLPKLPDNEVTLPTVQQVQALTDAIEPRYRAAIVMLAGSGLRIGELLGLRVADVDFLRRTVRVERQRRPSGELTTPKTSTSMRTVPLGRVVVDELAAHLAAYPSDEWLFTVADGGPVPYRRWKRVWANAASGELTTHDLRHFYASALIAGGASVKQVQTVLGHSSATTTLQVYSHLWPGDEDRTRAIVDSALSGLRTERGPDDLESSDAAGERG